MSQSADCFERIERAFKRAAEVLREARIEYMLGGSLAGWVRGGPESCNDLDLVIRPEDADRALEAFRRAGWRTDRPVDGWLVKTWDEDVLIDLIFGPMGVQIDDDAFRRAEKTSAWAVPVLAMDLDDVMVSKLLSMDEHALDFEPALQMARALRERFDWPRIRARTEESPYARGFFALLHELRLVPRTEVPRTDQPRIRIATAGPE